MKRKSMKTLKGTICPKSANSFSFSFHCFVKWHSALAVLFGKCPSSANSAISNFGHFGFCIFSKKFFDIFLKVTKTTILDGRGQISNSLLLELVLLHDVCNYFYFPVSFYYFVFRFPHFASKNWTASKVLKNGTADFEQCAFLCVTFHLLFVYFRATRWHSSALFFVLVGICQTLANSEIANLKHFTLFSVHLFFGTFGPTWWHSSTLFVLVGTIKIG